MPPLGLITVAALFPKNWTIRLSDRAFDKLLDADILWADLVMIIGNRLGDFLGVHVLLRDQDHLCAADNAGDQSQVAAFAPHRLDDERARPEARETHDGRGTQQ